MAPQPSPEIPTSSESTSSSSSSSSSVLSEASATPFVKRLNVLEEKIANLEKQTVKIEGIVEGSEKRTKAVSNFMTAVTYAVLASFTFVSFTYFFDYFRGNNERFEGYSKRINRLELKFEALEKSLQKKK